MDNVIYFRTRKNGNLQHHKIDLGGNHFVGKKCVNPKAPLFAGEKSPSLESTYPKGVKNEGIVEVTGNVLDDFGSFTYNEMDGEVRSTIRVTRAPNGVVLTSKI
jgi:hypothetical protein